MLVTYTDFSKKYDEWIDPEEAEHRVLKQWRGPDETVLSISERGMSPQSHDEIRLNNRIEVLDRYGKWREARVIDVAEVHPIDPKWDSEEVSDAAFERMLLGYDRYQS